MVHLIKGLDTRLAGMEDNIQFDMGDLGDLGDLEMEGD